MTTTVHTMAKISKPSQEAAHSSKTTSNIPMVPKLRLEEVKSLKEQIKEENAKLFKMQALVLHATWDSKVPQDPEYLQSLSARANRVEEHIGQLCMQLKTARAVESGNEGFDAWRAGQEAVAANIKSRVGQSTDPREAQAVVEEARTLEKEAELMVEELRANLQRGDTRQFASWERLHSKELAKLEAELAQARQNKQPCHAILLAIKACHNDMKKIRHVACESSAGSSSDSEDSEAEGEYEGLGSLSVGDRVRLIGEDEDGFQRGDCGSITEIDQSIAYPYRVTKRGADGWFKAIDLELVEKKHPVPLRVPQLQANPVSPKRAARDLSPTTCPPASPYYDTPYASGSDYEGDIGSDYEDVDLEKGRTSHLAKRRGSTPTLQAFLKSTKDVACTLNPLAGAAC